MDVAEAPSKELTQWGNYPVSSQEEMNVLIKRNKENNWPDLDIQNRAFAIEYIQDYNHRRAATEVGIPAEKGIRVLRDPLVIGYIATLQEALQTSMIITKDFINVQYMSLLEMATGERESAVIVEGIQMNAKVTNIPGAVAIVKEMSKAIEYAKETGEKKAPVTVNIDFGALQGPPPNITIEGEQDAEIT